MHKNTKLRKLMKWHIYFLIIGEVVDNNNLENSESEMIVSTSIYTILQHRMSNDSVRSEKITNNTRLTPLYTIE